MANYTVKKGDSLSKIAKSHGTTVSALVSANKSKVGGSPDKIFAGTVLSVPGGSGTGNSTAYKQSSTSSKPGTRTPANTATNRAGGGTGGGTAYKQSSSTNTTGNSTAYKQSSTSSKPGGTATGKGTAYKQSASSRKPSGIAARAAAAAAARAASNKKAQKK